MLACCASHIYFDKEERKNEKKRKKKAIETGWM